MLMAHDLGYFIEMSGEPSLYLSGDTILIPAVRRLLETRQPGVCLVSAGGARFDVGHEIIMGAAEVFALTQAAKGMVIANHLEALSHCPVKRTELCRAAAEAGIENRLRVPQDGEALAFRF